MSVTLYNIFIFFYSLFIRFATLFNSKARLFIKGRQSTFEDLERAFSGNKIPVAWFHVASLGEFEQAVPILEAFRTEYPGHKLLITFFSPSGYEQKKGYEGADHICYLPLDTRRNAKKLLDIVNPSLIVFVKYEFWYHYLNEAANRKKALYCTSALFTEDHIFFKPYGGLHRKMLSFFDHIFVQNMASEKLLAGIGIQKVSVSGDTRFDRVVQTLARPKHYDLVEQFAGGAPVMIVGSSWPQDMAYLSPTINDDSSALKFIIAPHEVHDQSIRQLEKGLNRKYLRYTEADPSNIEAAEVLIINTIGMLSSIYQYGRFAYIGGAFGDGLHNILEAVTFGLPVIFGNRGLDKFPESLELIERGGAFAFNTAEEFQSYFKQLSNDSGFLQGASEACKEYIAESTGATAHILNHWKANYEG